MELFIFVVFIAVISILIWEFIFSKRKKKRIELENLNKLIAVEEERLQQVREDTLNMEKKRASEERKLSSVQKDIRKHEELYRSMIYALKVFDSDSFRFGSKQLSDDVDLSDIAGRSSDDLMCLQIKELRVLFRKNQKQISNLIKAYQNRLLTKGNAAVFQLLVLALESEMREILHNLSFGKLEDALSDVRDLILKYHSIAAPEKLRLVASPITKFVGQLEYYYIEAVKIEYEYYVKRERAREEQRALKEQMRQEAEERKALEAQRKKMEAEEAKYEKEMDRISSLIASSTEADEIAKLKAQLEKVQSQLSEAQAKKEKIVTLQNGKAGTVYVISNIGSFGEDVFKIGMTRRDEPMDRVKELGDASVPFPFDVHSFIFSNDAVDLETKLHHLLNNKRINKINLRKEFFRVSLDELQALVEELDPSAAFNRTALAEQFRQSLSISEIPDTVDVDIEE